MDPTTWNAPFAVVAAALFVIVIFRAGATYAIGRLLARSAKRSRFSRVVESRSYQRASSWVSSWGPPAVTLSFLTIGFQTMVNLCAGMVLMPVRRYVPALVLGGAMWALVYATIGFVGVAAVMKLWAFSPALTIAAGVGVIILWVGYGFFARTRKATPSD